MKRLGFPRMHKEQNEKRAFLPGFFRNLARTGVSLYLEYGYGSKMGFSEDDYRDANEAIIFTTRELAFAQDIVVILRAPNMEELNLMQRGSILLSMLHYPTRAHRVKVLNEMGIRAVSLDSLRDDFLQRIVFNPKGTSENGMELAFKELAKARKDFFAKGRAPIEVSIMGLGPIGYRAARSAAKFGSRELNEKIKSAKAKGVIVHILPRNITADRREMSRILAKTDILVDASTRENPYRYIIDNDQLGMLKDDAIILDLTADPYLTDEAGVQVKAIEGTPTGNLNKTIMYTDDPAYEAIPSGVKIDNRRTVVSCDAWPGVKPEECMHMYGIQILPVLVKLIEKDVDEMTIDSPYYFERAIHRATIGFFEAQEDSGPT